MTCEYWDELKSNMLSHQTTHETCIRTALCSGYCFRRRATTSCGTNCAFKCSSCTCTNIVSYHPAITPQQHVSCSGYPFLSFDPLAFLTVSRFRRYPNPMQMMRLRMQPRLNSCCGLHHPGFRMSECVRLEARKETSTAGPLSVQVHLTSMMLRWTRAAYKNTILHGQSSKSFVQVNMGVSKN